MQRGDMSRNVTSAENGSGMQVRWRLIADRLLSAEFVMQSVLALILTTSAKPPSTVTPIFQASRFKIKDFVLKKVRRLCVQKKSGLNFLSCMYKLQFSSLPVLFFPLSQSRGVSLLQLPIELLTDIFEHLWDDRQALSVCALACRRLQPICQKALFFQITLDMAAPRAELGVDILSRLRQVPFMQSPRLASYMVRLDIKIVCPPEYRHSLEFLWTCMAALKNLMCLRDLRILVSPRTQISWEDFYYPLQISIMDVIRDRPLTRVCLTNLTGMPTLPFFNSSIRQLSLSSVSWKDACASSVLWNVRRVTAPYKTARLQSLNITLQDTQDSLSTIDHLMSEFSPFNLSELQSLRISVRFSIRSEDHLIKIRKLLSRVAGTLKYLWIHCNLEG